MTVRRWAAAALACLSATVVLAASQPNTIPTMQPGLTPAPVVIYDAAGNVVSTFNGGAASVADGADVAQGARADAAYAGSGSTTIIGALKGIYNALLAPTPAGTNNIGSVTTLPTAGAPGSSSSAVKAAATTNATLLKATGGNLYDYTLCNNAASARWVKFSNKTSAPVPGTDTPFFKIGIAPGACVVGNFSTPIRFSAGIGYSITAAVGDLDTTATAADDVTGVVNWM